MKKSFGSIVFFSLAITLAAQLNINLFITDFKLSVAVICFPAFLFIAQSFPVIPVTVFGAAGVFASRLLLVWLQNGRLSGAVQSYYPEVIFYLCYGLALYLYTRRLGDSRLNRNRAILPLFAIDYGANLIELLLRIRLEAFTPKAQASILLAAAARTAVIWCVLTVFAHYRLLLLKQEHEERYKRLVLLISKLDGEVMWMRKNTALIEDTMNTSYRLYERLKVRDESNPLARSALKVAKDIHEVKKEYLLIMRGISEALDEELEGDGMYLDELLELLKDTMIRSAAEHEKKLSMETDCRDRVYTNRHYALMSIFRNLFVNALEAAEKDEVHIYVKEQAEEDMFVFTVTDDGPGVHEEYQSEIFKTGFSTKINFSTGEVNRGLGLNLVKDLVEGQFGGTLALSSIPGRTTFTIRIPQEKMKVVV